MKICQIVIIIATKSLLDFSSFILIINIMENIYLKHCPIHVLTQCAVAPHLDLDCHLNNQSIQ